LGHKTLFPLILALLVVACGPVPADEVARVSSPDRRVEAVLVEMNGGATTSFGCEVHLTEKGKTLGDRVARLYGAVRNAHAYGADLKWKSDTVLVVEFLEAREQTFEKATVRIVGRDVRVFLAPGVLDPDAPAGGMFYNLQLKKRGSE